MTGTKLALILALLCSVSIFASAEETPAPQDEVLLKNGSKIIGVVTASRDGVVTMDTAFAGTLSIKSEDIQSMQTQGSLVMQMADGQIIENKPVTIEGEQVTIAPSTADAHEFLLVDVLLVNPEPWELGEGYKKTGDVSFAMVRKRGNTESDEVDYRLESLWRSLRDRYTVRLDGEFDKTSGIDTADNWSIVGKYDYFLDGPWYLGVNAAAKEDVFADLNLRTFVGPYVGRQFYDQPVFSLEGELGLSYVDEDFDVAEDQSYPGANWSIRIASNYLGGDTNLYLNHDAIWNLDTTEDIILNTRFGLSFPLLGNFEAAAEILYEYDTGAVEGIEELDETYHFRIGYTW
jgi:putative salt-induced outer membrane protein YdiY